MSASEVEDLLSSAGCDRELVSSGISDIDELEEEGAGQPGSMVVPAHLDGALRDDVLELFSPPRLVPRCARFQLRGQVSIDILCGYDLRKEDVQRQVLMMLESRRPRFLWCCAPCTMYSRINLLWNQKKVHPACWSRKQQAMHCWTSPLWP